MIYPRRDRATRRGFATLAAIALIGLVAVAMAAAAGVLRLDLRRTAGTLEDAQLRQLLLAGEGVARERLSTEPPAAPATAHVVSLPPPLAAGGASLRVTVTPAANDSATATVEAALAGRAAAQTLHYERGPGGWRLTGAELHASTSAGSSRSADAAGASKTTTGG